MSEWLTTKLGSVLGPDGYIRGPFGSSLLRDEMLTQGIPVYEQQHAIYDHRDFRFYIDEQKHKELERFTVKENDLIISCSGTLGKVSIIKKDDPKGIISQADLPPQNWSSLNVRLGLEKGGINGQKGLHSGADNQ